MFFMNTPEGLVVIVLAALFQRPYFFVHNTAAQDL